MSKELIRLEDVVMSFGGSKVLKKINLSIANREFLTILGPSGCGKTTTLRIIGGFETPDEGKVWFEGKDITNMPAHKRRVNTVFQKYALFTHMNVYDNVAFGLRLKKVPKDEIQKRVSEMLTMVNLKNYGTREISSLSGGEQQRIAIARALVNHPQVLLLDEPLGALDLKLRKGMQLELKKMQRALGITFIYVTHDQEEALTMSDTVVVMNKGRIQQIGTPIDIYNEPKNAFVADFIGESNIIDGIMERDLLVQFAGKRFECVDAGFEKDELVDVVIRPEDIKVLDKSDERAQIQGKVESVIFKGVHYEMVIRSENYGWLVHSTQSQKTGESVGLWITPEDIHIMRKAAAEDEEEED